MNQLLAIAYLVILNNYVSRNHMLMRHDPTNWSHLFLPKIPATAGKYKLLKYSASFSWDISLLRSWSSQSCLLLIDTVNAATWRFFPVKREIYEIPVSNHSYTFQTPHDNLLYSQEAAAEIWSYFTDSDYMCCFNFPVTVQTYKK